MTYNTTARRALTEFLREHSERAFTLEEIAREILEDGHGKSTLYRLMPRLVEEGCVRRISDEKRRGAVYQFIGAERCSEHLHLKCNGCGKLIHLDPEISHALGDTLKKKRGFTLDEGTLLLGKCKDCEEGRV